MDKLNNLKVKISNFFKNGLVLKLMSVFLAFVIWVIIISITNPFEHKDFSGSSAYTFTIPKLGHQIILEDHTGDETIKREYNVLNTVSDKISIYLSGRDEIIQNTTLEDIRVEIDEDSFGDFKGEGEYEVGLKVTSTKFGVNIDDYICEKLKSKKIKVYFDEIITKTVKVSVNISQSYFADGLILAKTSVVENNNYLPPEVHVTGFKSDVSEISEAIVEVINITDKISSEFNIVRACRYFNLKGEEITEIDPKTIEVGIFPGRKIDLYCGTTGKVPEGKYLKEGPVINPSTITILGPYDIIKNITSWEIDPISYDELGENSNIIQKNVDIKLLFGETGITISDETITPQVTIRFGDILDKSFNIARGDIKNILNPVDKYNYSIDKLSVNKISITGNDVDIDKIISISNLEPTIDIKKTDWGIGSREFPVTFKLPNGIQIIGDITVTVTTTEKPVDTPVMLNSNQSTYTISSGGTSITSPTPRTNSPTNSTSAEVITPPPATETPESHSGD